MGFADTVRECEDLAKTVQSTEGVFFVPAFSGLGSPYWDMYARGTIIGLTKGTNKSHICRAAIEAICYQVRDILSCMSTDTKLPLKALKVDGGVSVSDLMLQFQSDILNAVVFRPANIETTSFGTAFLAGMAVGLWKNQNEILNFWKIDKSFTPVMDVGTRHDLYKQWLKAVGRSQNWLPGYLPYKNMEVLEEER